MVDIVILIVGFVLLVWGAERFVNGTSSLAKRLGVPSLIIGLTVVAFGTSAPELSVSVIAGINGSNDIALGNVLGSNIFNLLCILGVCALIKPLTVNKEILKRDFPISIFITILLLVLAIISYKISKTDSVILLFIFSGIIFLQIKTAKKGNQNVIEKNNFEQNETSKIILNIVLGLASIILGGQFCVNGATEIARMLGLSETVIGLTIVAVGTSLPELATSIIATKKGETDIAIGNVIGSNIFNILFILGISSFLNPIAIKATAILDTIFLLLISIIIFLFAIKNKLTRFSAVLLILIYISYTSWLIIR